MASTQPPTPTPSTTTTTTRRSPSPPPARSLHRQVILDEDDYTAALSHIIARDFFPSLVHLDATHSYLDALRTNDPALIGASVRRLEALATPTPARARAHARPWQTPSETPFGAAAGPADTPLPGGRTPSASARGDGDGDGPSTAKRPRYDGALSLDVFQARYTSEDNASFTHLLDDENRRRKERHAWAWDAQRRVEGVRSKMVEGRERMLLELPEGARVGVRERIRIEAPEPKGLIAAAPEDEDEDEDEDGEAGDDQEGRAEKGLMILKGKEKAPEVETEAVDVMAPKKDTRPAAVDGWSFKARNALMFPPDADVLPYDPSTAVSKPSTEPDPRVIKHSNTRLPTQEDSSFAGLPVPPSPTRSRIDAAIAGTPYRPRSPGINHFSYVPALPSPTPSELGPDAVKQLMTVGTLMGTPRILSQSDDPADASLPPPSTPFHIRAPTSREALSHRLSSAASRSLRTKANLMGSARARAPEAALGSGKKGDMGPPSWTPRRADAAGALTPAAKRLLDRSTLGTAAARRAEVMGRRAGWEGTSAKEKDLNRVRWTPTPSPVTRRG